MNPLAALLSLEALAGISVQDRENMIRELAEEEIPLDIQNDLDPLNCN